MKCAQSKGSSAAWITRISLRSARDLAAGIQALEQATQWVLQTIGQDPNAALAASVNYMMLTGYVCGGWQMARAALGPGHGWQPREDQEFCRAKIATARFYAEQILPKASALLDRREERRLHRLRIGCGAVLIRRWHARSFRSTSSTVRFASVSRQCCWTACCCTTRRTGSRIGMRAALRNATGTDFEPLGRPLA